MDAVRHEGTLAVKLFQRIRDGRDLDMAIPVQQGGVSQWLGGLGECARDKKQSEPEREHKK